MNVVLLINSLCSTTT